MCKIRLLVIGNSYKRNHDMVERIKSESVLNKEENIPIVITTIYPFYAKSILPEDYDLAVVDESVIAKECCKSVLGAGTPILTFGEVQGTDQIASPEIIPNVVKKIVEKNLLCDYIIKVTEEIDSTHKMLVEYA